jgi:phosphatidate cytidylyltransferase
MKRIATALIVGPAVVAAVLWAPEWLFLIVLAAVAVLCFYEYGGIAAAYGIEKPGIAGYVAGLILLFSIYEPALLIVLFALLALGFAMTSADLRQSLPRAAAFLLGIVYIFGAWHWAIPLRLRSPYWLLFALALMWIGDTAAYYGGRAFGKRKMAPRISPGKTWAGSVASIVGSVVFGILFTHYLLPDVAPGWAVALSAAGNIAGQIGDLAESALKRGAGLKDSGTMLPGHGGWLDRVDSALFTLPVIYWMLAVAGARIP